MRHAVDQLVRAESTESALLGNQPAAGRAFDFGEEVELSRIIHQWHEHGLTQPRARDKPNGARECLANQRQV